MQPLPYSAGYSAAKAYVLTFSEAIHQELRGRGVTVTALCPGAGLDRLLADLRLGGAGRQDVRERGAQAGLDLARRTRPAPGSRASKQGDRVVVPGLPVRAAMHAARYLPHAVKLPVLERIMRDK